jgi:ABC-type transport system involved in multi-copper enzyme maturation permease subunit/ABC-type uncharacterized transport system involved in gliding motility auxiliary subunit
MNPTATFAIFKRNFLAYFTDPTGYVFICIYVLLNAFAAFFPDEFWADNLANFDQVNSWFPWIMLFFVPAITMSVWAGERSNGTDELLLTMPASDWDVVIGKYMATVAIFTVSVLFSTTNVLVLSYLASPSNLGEAAMMGPDYGILLANFIGYWLVGVAMLAVGMAASFLTSNLTIAFILGVLLNSPLVALYYARSFLSSETLADFLREGSIAEHFQDFGRGLVTLSAVTYFIGIAVAMIYVCMVLIGERHWAMTRRSSSAGPVGTPPGASSSARFVPIIISVVALVGALAWLLYSIISSVMNQVALTQWDIIGYLLFFIAWLLVVAAVGWFLRRGGEHYFLRIIAVFVVIGSIVALTQQTGFSVDLSSEQLSTLSPQTRALLTNLRSASGSVVAEPAPTKTTFAGDQGLRDVDGSYTGAFLRFTSGDISGQVRRVTEYKGDSRTFTLDRELPSPPPAGTTFAIERPPVVIEAFVSPSVPEDFVQTRLNLLTMLRQLQSLGGKQIQVRVYNTEPSSDAAATAEEQYGITPRQVGSQNRGSISVEEVFLGVAVTSGTDKVVIPFFDRGLPPEYELVRSVAIVSQQQRRKLGIVTTDVPLFGGLNPMTFQPSADMPIVAELRKQYDVSEVDLSQDVKPGDYDALMVVQPSSLAPDQLERLIAAVKAGVPVAIFEDPFTFMDDMTGQYVPGTSQPRRNQMAGMFGGGQPPPPKGDITRLFALLGLVYDDQEVVADNYNPFPRFGQFPPTFVFVGPGALSDEPFNRESAITSDLRAPLMFLYPGSLESLNTSPLEFVPLARSGRESGYLHLNEIESQEPNQGGYHRNSPPKEYVLAARVSGRPAATATQGEGANPPEINTVVVTDIDMLYPAFFMMRERGTSDNNLDLDNVAFVLNIIDELAGDDRFMGVRTRRRSHRTLARLDEVYQEAATERTAAVNKAEDDIETKRETLQEQLDQEIEEIQNDTSLSALERRQLQQFKLQEKQIALAQFNREQEQGLQDVIRAIERKQDRQIREVQDSYKLAAVALPPIPPLVIALVVFLMRRAREQQGVNTRRLRP